MLPLTCRFLAVWASLNNLKCLLAARVPESLMEVKFMSVLKPKMTEAFSGSVSVRVEMSRVVPAYIDILPPLAFAAVGMYPSAITKFSIKTLKLLV